MALRRNAPLLILVAFWAALYLTHLLSAETLPARDVGATQIPWREVWRGQVLRGRLPLWDPLSNQGRPLAANPNAMAYYPGTALFLVLPPEAAAAWHLAFHHLVLLLGCYRLARRCGATPAAAGFAAAAAGTSGVAFSLLTFVNAQASFSWVPWALAAAVDPPPTARGRTCRALTGGVFLGLAALGGEPVVALLAAFGWSLVVAWTWRPNPVAACLVGAGAAFLTAAPLLVPLIAVVSETVRGALGAPPGALGADALRPERWAELLFPNLLGPPLAGLREGFWAQPSFPWGRYYPLVFPGSLAILALLAAPRHRSLAPWWALGGVGLAGAMLSGVSPLAHAMERVPGVGALRFGIKHLLLVVLATVPLAAAGWDRLEGRWREGGRRLVARWAAAGILLVPLALVPSTSRRLLAALYPASATTVEAVPAPAIGRSIAGDVAVLAVPPVLLLVAGPSAPVAMAAVLAANAVAARGVLLFDDGERWAAVPAVARSLPPRSRLVVEAERGSPERGPSQPGLARFWGYRTALVSNYATRWGHGYVLSRGPDGLEPAHQELLAAAAETLPLEARLRVATALGANAAVLPSEDVDGPCDAIDGVCAVPLPGAPDAYLAQRTIQAEGPLAVVHTLADMGFRPGVDAVIAGTGGAASLSGGELDELPGRPDRRHFQTRSAGPGLLVVQQSYLSAWRALVDGTPAVVQPVNGAGLGIRLPPGEHRVVVFFDARPAWFGLAGPPLLALLALVLRRRRTDSKR